MASTWHPHGRTKTSAWHPLDEAEAPCITVWSGAGATALMLIYIQQGRAISTNETTRWRKTIWGSFWGAVIQALVLQTHDVQVNRIEARDYHQGGARSHGGRYRTSISPPLERFDCARARVVSTPQINCTAPFFPPSRAWSATRC